MSIKQTLRGEGIGHLREALANAGPCGYEGDRCSVHGHDRPCPVEVSRKILETGVIEPGDLDLEEDVEAEKGLSYVFMGHGGVCCARCGEVQKLPELTLNVLLGACRGFEKDHARCEEGDGGRARYEYTNLTEWKRSWDTGISSETIFHVLAGHYWDKPHQGPDVPYDPDDFGRCYRLLKVAPEGWRGRLGEVADRYPEWGPLVAHWDEVEALYEEELESPDSKAPKTYELIQQLVRVGRDLKKGRG